MVLSLPFSIHSQNLGKGFDAIEAHDFDNAKKVFDDAVIVNDHDIVALYGLAKVYNARAYKNSDPAKAIELIQKAEKEFKIADEKELKKMEKFKVGKAEIAFLRTSIEKRLLELIDANPNVDAYDE